MQDGNEGIGDVLRQALLSGAIVAAILVTVVGALYLTQIMGGPGVDPFKPVGTGQARAVISSPTLAPSPLPAPTATASPLPPTATAVPPSATPVPPSPTPSPAAPTPTETVIVILVETPTPQPALTPIECPPPAGWQAYLVQQSDTLASLSFRTVVPVAQIRAGNCMAESSALAPGQIIYLPPTQTLPTATTVRAACTRPWGWSPYTVRAGDTLSRLAAQCGITTEAVMLANCLSTTYIYAGQSIYLPCVPPYQPAYPTQPVYPTQPPVWPTATRPVYPTATRRPPTATYVPPTTVVIPPTSTPSRQPATIAPPTQPPATVAPPTPRPTVAPPTVRPTAVPPTVRPTVAPPTPRPTKQPTVAPTMPPISTATRQH